MATATNELIELARVIADWAAAGGSEMTVYVFGSRVRGDHSSDSDVDIHVRKPTQPSRAFTEWWTAQNLQDFDELRRVLPGRLEPLEPTDPLSTEVEAGKVIHRDRNVICICRAPKEKG
jgi:predicted nucleotidyltransferase